MQDLQDKKVRMEPRSSADVIRRQRWELVRTRALRLLEKFDPDQPRDEDGKWTSDGSDGSATVQGDQQQKPTGKRPSLYQMSKKVSEATVAKVNSALDAIPVEHREALATGPGQLGVAVKVYQDSKQFPVAEKYKHASGLFLEHADGRKEIQIAETIQGAPPKSIERVMAHELGHAYNAASDRMAEHDIPSLRKMTSRMTPGERDNAKYFISNSSEMFAELYSLTYSPDKSSTYFNMPREKALEVFKEGVDKMKSLGSPSSYGKIFDQILTKAQKLLKNGIFVTADRTVYAIVNGSAYELDVTDTPLANLPPGDYTEEEAEAALTSKPRSLPVHELFKVRVWLGLQGLKA